MVKYNVPTAAYGISDFESQAYIEEKGTQLSSKAAAALGRVSSLRETVEQAVEASPFWTINSVTQVRVWSSNS